MNKLKIDFWKASPKGGGSAAIFNFDPEDQSLFFNMRGQIGTEKAFEKDKKKHLNASLGIPDLGEMLLVLRGQNKGLGQPTEDGKFKGLYHTFGEKEDGNNTIIGLSECDRGYYLSLSVRRGKFSGRESLLLTWGEAEVLRIFLTKVLENFFVDSYRRADKEPEKGYTKPAAPATTAKASPSAKKTSPASETAPTPVGAGSSEEEIPF